MYESISALIYVCIICYFITIIIHFKYIIRMYIHIRYTKRSPNLNNYSTVAITVVYTYIWAVYKNPKPQLFFKNIFFSTWK